MEALVIIRPARSSDENDLFPLVKAFASSFTPDPEAFRESFGRILNQEDALLLVADLDGRLLGYCLSFDHLAFFANGRVAWVEEIMVDEASRRTGLGKLLMLETEKWAAGRGCRLIALATRRAASFYSAIGYSESAAYFRKLL